jgi:hypothetical protein
VTETFQELALELDLSELTRYLGYPQGWVPANELRARVERVARQHIEVLEPRGTYSVYTVSARAPHGLTLGGVTIRGKVGEYLGSSDRVAAFVVTVGDGIGRLAQELCAAGDALEGWVCDALGSWAAEAAADALMARLQARLASGEGLTLRYSPGYCGMDMDQQPALFELTRPASVGVSLLPSQFMAPAKSVSGLVGIGPATVQQQLSPCDRCPQRGCHMRRESPAIVQGKLGAQREELGRRCSPPIPLGPELG